MAPPGTATIQSESPAPVTQAGGPSLFESQGHDLTGDIPQVYQVNYTRQINSPKLTSNEKQDWQKLFHRVGMAALMPQVIGLIEKGGINEKNLKGLDPLARGAAVIFLRTLFIDAGFDVLGRIDLFEDLFPLIGQLKGRIAKLAPKDRPPYLTNPAEWNAKSSTVSLNLVRYLFGLSAARIGSVQAFNQDLASGKKVVLDFSSDKAPFVLKRKIDRSANNKLSSEFISKDGSIHEIPDPASPLGGFLRIILSEARGKTMSREEFESCLIKWGGDRFLEYMGKINTAMKPIRPARNGKNKDALIHRNLQISAEYRTLQAEMAGELRNAPLMNALRLFAHNNKFGSGEEEQEQADKFIKRFNQRHVFEKAAFLLEYRKEILAAAPANERDGVTRAFEGISAQEQRVIAFGRNKARPLYEEAVPGSAPAHELEVFRGRLFIEDYNQVVKKKGKKAESRFKKSYRAGFARMHAVSTIMAEIGEKVPGNFEFTAAKDALMQFIQIAQLMPGSNLKADVFSDWDRLSPQKKIDLLRKVDRKLTKSASGKFYVDFGLFAYGASSGLIRNGVIQEGFKTLTSSLQTLRQDLKTGKAKFVKLGPKAYFMEEKGIVEVSADGSKKIRTASVLATGAPLSREARASLGRFLISSIRTIALGSDIYEINSELNSLFKKLGISLPVESYQAVIEAFQKNPQKDASVIVQGLILRAAAAEKALKDKLGDDYKLPKADSPLEQIALIFEKYEKEFGHNQDPEIKADVPIDANFLPGVTWKGLIAMELAAEKGKYAEVTAIYLKDAGTVNQGIINQYSTYRAAHLNQTLTREEIAGLRATAEGPLLDKFLEAQEQLIELMDKALAEYKAPKDIISTPQALKIYRDFVSGKYTLAVKKNGDATEKEIYYLYDPGTGSRRKLNADSPELIVAKALMRFAMPEYGAELEHTLGQYGNTKHDVLSNAILSRSIRTSGKDQTEEIGFRLADYLYTNLDCLSIKKEAEQSTKANKEASDSILKTGLGSVLMRETSGIREIDELLEGADKKELRQLFERIYVTGNRDAGKNAEAMKKELLRSIQLMSSGIIQNMLTDPSIRESLLINLSEGINKLVARYVEEYKKEEEKILKMISLARDIAQKFPHLQDKPEWQELLSRLETLHSVQTRLISTKVAFINSHLGNVITEFVTTLQLEQEARRGTLSHPMVQQKISGMVDSTMRQIFQGYTPGEWEAGKGLDLVEGWTVIGRTEFSQAGQVGLSSFVDRAERAERIQGQPPSGRYTHISAYNVSVWRDFNEFAEFEGGEPIPAYRIGLYALTRRYGITTHNPVEAGGIIRGQITASDLRAHIRLVNSEAANILGTKQQLTPAEVQLLTDVARMIEDGATGIHFLYLEENDERDLARIWVDESKVANPDEARQKVLSTIKICRRLLRALGSLAQQSQDGRLQLMQTILGEGRPQWNTGMMNATTFARDLWSRLAEYEQAGARRSMSNVDESLVISLKEEFYGEEIDRLRRDPGSISAERTRYLSSGEMDKDFLLHLIDNYGFLFRSSLMQAATGAFPQPIDANERTQLINRNPLLQAIWGTLPGTRSEQDIRLEPLREYIENMPSNWGSLNVTTADDRSTVTVKFMVQAVMYLCRPETGSRPNNAVHSNAVPFRTSNRDAILDRHAMKYARILKGELLQRGTEANGTAWGEGISLQDDELNATVLNSVALIFDEFNEMLRTSPQQEHLLHAIAQTKFEDRPWFLDQNTPEDNMEKLVEFADAIRARAARGESINLSSLSLLKDKSQIGIIVFMTSILPLMGMMSEETSEGGINFALSMRQAYAEAHGLDRPAEHEIELKCLNFSSGEETLYSTESFRDIPVKDEEHWYSPRYLFDRMTGESGKPLAHLPQKFARDYERWQQRRKHFTVGHRGGNIGLQALQTMVYFKGLRTEERLAPFLKGKFVKRIGLGKYGERAANSRYYGETFKWMRGAGAAGVALGMLSSGATQDYALAGGYALSLLAGTSSQRISIMWMTQGTGFWLGGTKALDGFISGNSYWWDDTKHWGYTQALAAIDLIGPFFPPVLLSQVLKNVYDGNYEDAVSNLIGFSMAGMMSNAHAETYTFARNYGFRPALNSLISILQRMPKLASNAPGADVWRRELYERKMSADAAREFSINPDKETLGEIFERAKEAPNSRAGRWARKAGLSHVAEFWSRSVSWNFAHFWEVMNQNIWYRLGRAAKETYHLFSPERMAKAMGFDIKNGKDAADFKKKHKRYVHERMAKITEFAVDNPTAKINNLSIELNGKHPYATKGTMAHEAQSLSFKKPVELSLYGYEYAATLEERIEYRKSVSRATPRRFSKIHIIYQDAAEKLVDRINPKKLAGIARRQNLSVEQARKALARELSHRLANEVGDQSMRALAYRSNIRGLRVAWKRADIHLKAKAGSDYFGAFTKEVGELQRLSQLKAKELKAKLKDPEVQDLLRNSGIDHKGSAKSIKANLSQTVRTHLDRMARLLDGHTSMKLEWEQSEGAKNLKGQVKQLNNLIAEYNSAKGTKEPVLPAKIIPSKSIEATKNALKGGARFGASAAAAVLSAELLKIFGIDNKFLHTAAGFAAAHHTDLALRRFFADQPLLPKGRKAYVAEVKGALRGIAYMYLASSLYRGVLDAFDVNTDSLLRCLPAQLIAGIGGSHALSVMAARAARSAQIGTELAKVGLGPSRFTTAAAKFSSRFLLALAVLSTANDLAELQGDFSLKKSVMEDKMAYQARIAAYSDSAIETGLAYLCLGFFSLPVFDKLPTFFLSDSDLKAKATQYLEQTEQVRAGARARLSMLWGNADGKKVFADYDGGPRPASFFTGLNLSASELAKALRTRVHIKPTYTASSTHCNGGTSGQPAAGHMQAGCGEIQIQDPQDKRVIEHRVYQRMLEIRHQYKDHSKLMAALQAEFGELEDPEGFMQKVMVMEFQQQMAILASRETVTAEDAAGSHQNADLRRIFNEDGTLKQGKAAEEALIAWMFKGKQDKVRDTIMEERKATRFHHLMAQTSTAPDGRLVANSGTTMDDIEIGLIDQYGNVNSQDPLVGKYQKHTSDAVVHLNRFALLMDGEADPIDEDLRLGFVTRDGKINQEHPFYALITRTQEELNRIS
jgi:hypothetical protein